MKELKKLLLILTAILWLGCSTKHQDEKSKIFNNEIEFELISASAIITNQSSSTHLSICNG